METGADRPAVEFLKCSADAAYFIDSYGLIDDAQGLGDGSGVMPFRLWDCQVGLMWSLMTTRLALILKARQLGISWLVCGYALWLCLFSPGKLVLLFSQGELEAVELLRRIRTLSERLPDWLKDRLPTAERDTTTELGWSNGSMVRSLPATKKAGRSFTASLVIVDEAAFALYADALYAALKPTIDAGGQLIVLSTANGLGNLFHRLWAKASAGANDFRTTFLPWWSRPGRDAAWYARVVAESDDPALVKQEYPANPTEAFVASGRVRFPSEWVAAQAKNVRPGLPRASWPASLRSIESGLTVYELPGPAAVIGADVAEGLEKRDWSDAVVLGRGSRAELAVLHGHWEPDEFGRLLKALSGAYSTPGPDGTPISAPVLPERNNHGHAVIAALRRLGAPVLTGHDKRYGWLTLAQTKPQIVDALAVALRDGAITIRTQAALDELQVYSVLDDGTTGAPARYHDDRVMSRAIALAAIQRRRVLTVKVGDE
jgi:hypothetical protein